MFMVADLDGAYGISDSCERSIYFANLLRNRRSASFSSTSVRLSARFH